jgi:hypothetical protein
VALIAPLGIVLGTAMPSGLRRFRGLHPDGVPYAWGVNGVGSLLASVFGVALAVTFGFAVTSLVAGACYVAAVIHAIVGRWPDRLPEVALAQRPSEEDRPAAVVATVATVRPRRRSKGPAVPTRDERDGWRTARGAPDRGRVAVPHPGRIRRTLGPVGMLLPGG